MPPGAFLQPTAEQKAALKTKQDEAAKQKRAVAKVKAAERKRKREEDAERVKAIEQHIVRDRPPPPPLPRQHAIEDRAVVKVKAYLASPPYYGRSDIEDKDRIKELCGERQRVWDKQRKMWGTRLAGNLENLVHCGKWQPFGIEEEWLPYFVVAARERAAEESAHAEAVVNVKWENANEEIKAKHAAEAAEGGMAQPNVKERAAASRAREVDDLMVCATSKDVEACARLGLAEDAIAASRYWPELGPRSGTSDESRLLRWFDIARTNRSYDFEGVPEVFWNPAKLQPLLDETTAQLTAECNARARLASSAH